MKVLTAALNQAVVDALDQLGIPPEVIVSTLFLTLKGLAELFRAEDLIVGGGGLTASEVFVDWHRGDGVRKAELEGRADPTPDPDVS